MNTLVLDNTSKNTLGPITLLQTVQSFLIAIPSGEKPGFIANYIKLIALSYSVSNVLKKTCSDYRKAEIKYVTDISDLPDNYVKASDSLEALKKLRNVLTYSLYEGERSPSRKISGFIMSSAINELDELILDLELGFNSEISSLTAKLEEAIINKCK